MLDTKILWLVPGISLLGSIGYIYDVLKGRAKPNRVTWVLWALAPLVAFAAEIHAGIGLQSLAVFMAGFGPLLIVIASYVSRKAVWKLTPFDFVCGGLSLLGLILWLWTRHGDVAIIFAIAADALAAAPTLIKSYKNPESETSFVFAMGAVSSGLTLLTIDSWTVANAAFAAYLFAICVVFILLIKFKLGRYLSTILGMKKAV
jgi:hypothetical protein